MNYTIVYQVDDDSNKTIEVTIYEPLPYMNDIPYVKSMVGEDGEKVSSGAMFTAVSTFALSSVVAASMYF